MVNVPNFECSFEIRFRIAGWVKGVELVEDGSCLKVGLDVKAKSGLVFSVLLRKSLVTSEFAGIFFREPGKLVGRGFRVVGHCEDCGGWFAYIVDEYELGLPAFLCNDEGRRKVLS